PSGGSSVGSTAGGHGYVAPSAGGASVVPTPAIPADKAGQTATSPVQQAATAPQVAVNASSIDDGRTRRVGILVLAAGAALGLWAWRTDNLTRLSSIAATAAGAPGPTAAGGLGRFVRPRSGQPPALTCFVPHIALVLAIAHT